MRVVLAGKVREVRPGRLWRNICGSIEVLAFFAYILLLMVLVGVAVALMANYASLCG